MKFSDKLRDKFFPYRILNHDEVIEVGDLIKLKGSEIDPNDEALLFDSNNRFTGKIVGEYLCMAEDFWNKKNPEYKWVVSIWRKNDIHR